MYHSHVKVCICLLETKWEYNEAVQQFFKDFKKANDSVRREICIIFSLSLVYL